MKVLIVIIILVILYIIIKYEKTIDKFTMKLTPPKILKVQKDGFNAKVEWHHTNPDIQDYVLLYVDIAKLASGVWVQNNITCKTRRCKLVIQNLDGKRYNMKAGNLYFINVGEKVHWLKNNSKNDRYTLIIDMKPTKEITEKICAEYSI